MESGLLEIVVTLLAAPAVFGTVAARLLLRERKKEKASSKEADEMAPIEEET